MTNDNDARGALIAELDWCITDGCRGPRTLEALTMARAALAAPRQPGEMGAGVQTLPLDEADLARMHVRPTAAQQDEREAQWRDNTGRLTSDYEPTPHEIKVARDAICREFGNNGTDGYYIRILKAIHGAAQSVDDGAIREIVNQLRDIAINFHDTQQLRARIASVVVPRLKEVRQVQADAGAVAIYQRLYFDAWHDVSKKEYNGCGPSFRRIVYTRPAAESDKRDMQVEKWRLDSEELEAFHMSMDKHGVPRATKFDVQMSAFGRAVKFAAMSREQSGGDRG